MLRLLSCTLCLGLAAAACSGDAVPDVEAGGRCYHGAKTILGEGETVDITLEDFDSNSNGGHFSLSGTGVTGFTCATHSFTKSGQSITTDVSDCLPKGVKVISIKYCSDQDSLELNIDDTNIPWGMGKLTVDMNNVECLTGLKQASMAGSCDSDDQAAINQMPGGDDTTGFPYAVQECASKSLGLFGMDKDTFNACLTKKTGAKDACTSCFYDASEYGFHNCKLACISKWCSSKCLTCNAPHDTDSCAGFKAPQPTPCDTSEEQLGSDVDSEWEDFKRDFNRDYPDHETELARWFIFKMNRIYQNYHNALKSTYTMGVNEFTDISAQEFAQHYFGYEGGAKKMWSGLRKLGTHNAMEGEVIADSIDWVSAGAVTAVKNQGQCGSCWSFSTTGGLEGAWEIATKKLVSLSEQQFVDCNTKTDSGCNGGLMDNAFKWAEGEALCTENSYPYHASQGNCAPGGCTVGIPLHGVTGFTDVDQTEAAFVSALNKQPVSIAIEADKSAFQSYTGGVLQALCGTQLDHGVLCVGYGTDSSVKYWKVKNSWGGGWGEKGYIRLLRGKGGKGECGILSAGSYPQVNGDAPPSPAPKPSPTPAPTPPAPPGSDYQKPPCNSDETEFKISNGDVFCSPQCSSTNTCPKATTGEGVCALSYGGANWCVDQCGSAADCPSGANCDNLGFVSLCAFPGSASTRTVDVSAAYPISEITV